MKAVKTFFIKRSLLKSSGDIILRSYPTSFQKIGILTNSGFELDTNLILKLQNTFGQKAQILIFVLNVEVVNNNDFSLSTNDFSWIGTLRKMTIKDHLGSLDLLIDMTFSDSIERKYIINKALKAYKITWGANMDSNFNLGIKMKEYNQNLFAAEINKYHNILRNG